LSELEEIWLDQAKRHLSDNRDERPEDTEVNLLVIHSISLPPGEFGGGWIDDLFMNRLAPDAHPYFREIHQLKVSSHLLIRRDGQMIQYVPLNQRAWHAGTSNYCGREQCNDFSIGIELEGADDQPFTDAQYLTLSQATEAIMHLYPAIDKNKITSHAAISPGRKTDPGPLFDWSRYLNSLNSSLT
jgi:AmpD protein